MCACEYDPTMLDDRRIATSTRRRRIKEEDKNAG
jgi:hypothetical protein